MQKRIFVRPLRKVVRNPRDYKALPSKGCMLPADPHWTKLAQLKDVEIFENAEEARKADQAKAKAEDKSKNDKEKKDTKTSSLA